MQLDYWGTYINLQSDIKNIYDKMCIKEKRININLYNIVAMAPCPADLNLHCITLNINQIIFQEQNTTKFSYKNK